MVKLYNNSGSLKNYVIFDNFCKNHEIVTAYSVTRIWLKFVFSVFTRDFSKNHNNFIHDKNIMKNEERTKAMNHIFI